MNLEAWEPDGDPEAVCQLNLTASCPAEWRLLTALYLAFVRGGQVAVYPDGLRCVRWSLGEEGQGAPPRKTPFETVGEFGGEGPGP